jgi:hemoglobin/transferrin/lactoferrin receptor protein
MKRMGRAALVCATGLAAAAQAVAQQTRPAVLEPVTVTATRVERPVSDTPGTVSVVDAETMERTGVRDMRDLGRLEPGVTVGNQINRGGLTNFTIRGIGENRVRVQVDGIRLPDFPATNTGPGTYTRDFVDPETLKRVEIVRGPASALYGSDAIGGVVAYQTKDPVDYLDEVGKDWFVSGRAFFESADRTRGITATAAGRAGELDALLLVSRRMANAFNPKGSRDLNPTDLEQNTVLGKFIWNATPVDQLKLAIEYGQRDVSFNLLTDLSATVLSSRAKDETRRLRASLDHAHDAPFAFFDKVEWRLFTHRVDRTENTDQMRLTGGRPARRLTNLDYTQTLIGGEIQFSNRFEIAGTANRLIYGLAVETSQTSRPRDRTETNLVTGAVTKSFSGGPGVPPELFPNKNFPDTDTLQGGVFAQNEVTIGPFSLLPGLRVDYYKLSPTIDQAFRNTNLLGSQVRAFDAMAVSPKFGAVWRLHPSAAPFFQYARGFRAPPYDDANLGFTNGPQRYEVLPNPNLRPETSDGFEIGVRGRFGDRASYQVSAFLNNYNDFIVSRRIGTRAGLDQFQAQNIARARIIGVEAKGDLRLAPEWSLFASMAFAEGRDDTTKRPIDQVAPFTTVGGVRYDDIEGRYGARLTSTIVARHDAVSDPTTFRAPGHTTFDLTAYYELAPTLTVNAGVRNLTDQRHFQYLDVNGLAANRTDIDRYAQAGRTFFVNATVRF